MERKYDEIAMTEESAVLPDEVEVLKSIYPEIQIHEGWFSLEIKLQLSPELEVLYTSTHQDTTKEKVLKWFNTKYMDPLIFKSPLVMNSDAFELNSTWLNSAILDEKRAKINEMINDAIETDTKDSLLYTVVDYLTVQMNLELVELLSGSHIKTHSEVFYNQLLEKSNELRSLYFNQDRFTCSICLESYDGVDGLLLDCDHAFCKPCLKEYALQIINSDDVSKLQCPNCPIPNLKNLHSQTSEQLKVILFKPKVRKELLSQILEPETIEKYETMRHNFLFEKYQQYFPFSCSKCPRCSHWIFRQDVDDKLVVCDSCKLAYCFQCNHSWHGTANYCGSKMNTIPIQVIEDMLRETTLDAKKEKYQQLYGRKTLKLAIDSYISEKMFREAVDNDDDLVDCPRCSTVVTKSDGCNKMKCAVCSTHFCYLCGEMLDTENPYTHYTSFKSACYGRLFEGMQGVEDPA